VGPFTIRNANGRLLARGTHAYVRLLSYEVAGLAGTYESWREDGSPRARISFRSDEQEDGVLERVARWWRGEGGGAGSRDSRPLAPFEEDWVRTFSGWREASIVDLAFFGVLDDVARGWHRDGSPAFEATFDGEGRASGTWRTWRVGGTRACEIHFDGDVPDVPDGSVECWYSNGRAALTGRYARGAPVGSWALHDANGVRVVAARFSDAGELEGPVEIREPERTPENEAALLRVAVFALGQLAPDDRVGRLAGARVLHMVEEVAGHPFRNEADNRSRARDMVIGFARFESDFDYW
jgi:hypothetical protein